MPTVALASANVICTAAQIAAVLGVTDRRVRQLTKDGVLKCARTRLNGMHFRLNDSVQCFVAHREQCVTKQAKAADDDYNQARAKRMAAMAALAELELRAKRRDYLYKPDVEFHLSMLLRNCRDRVLAISSRTMHQLVGQTDAKECNRIVSAAVDLALNEIADKRCFDWARMRREQTDYLRDQGFADDDIEVLLDEQDRRRNGKKPIEAD